MYVPLFSRVTIKLEITYYNSYIQNMKRRNFLKGAAALFVLPSFPIKALASAGSAVSAPMASRSAVDVAYIWCRQFIENKPDFTPNMLTQSLGFSEKIVDEVLAKMVKNQVVKPSLVKGVFKRVDSPIDFISRDRLNSVLDMKSKYSEFLEAEEIREEELADVTQMIGPSAVSTTHAGMSAQVSFA